MNFFFADFSLFSLYVMFVSWSSSHFCFLSSLLPKCYWIFITSYLVIRSNNIFHAHFYHFHCLTKSNNVYKIVCILFPNCQSYFNFLHPLWVFLNSQRIQHKFVQHNPNNPNPLSKTQKKTWNNANNLF